MAVNAPVESHSARWVTTQLKAVVNCEDTKHVFFGCVHAEESLDKIGFNNSFEDATQLDRLGSAVLEELLSKQHAEDVKEFIITISCYIWWIRRKMVYGEQVPPAPIAAMSI
jgi:hypothetical protein